MKVRDIESELYTIDPRFLAKLVIETLNESDKYKDKYEILMKRGPNASDLGFSPKSFPDMKEIYVAEKASNKSIRIGTIFDYPDRVEYSTEYATVLFLMERDFGEDMAENLSTKEIKGKEKEMVEFSKRIGDQSKEF